MEGQTVSHYRVLGRVGAGGMGVVYRAEDTRLKRPVAIKMLSPHLTSDDEARDRFQQEAHAASLLEHPNICTIHEIDSTPDGQLFIVMAYCEGETLKSRLARGPLPIAEAVEVTVQILRALQKAHEAGIVHRDVKPANVMVDTDGLVRLVDFGIAKLHDRVDLTRTGTTVGTMAYMSPEQIAGEAADARTDLWAAGVVFYEALAGRPPFRGDSEVAIINHILRGDPAPLHTLRPEVPRALVGVAQRALAKSPALRFASATEFIALLRASQHEAIPSTTPGGTRFRWQIAAVVALVAVAGIGGTIAWNVKRSNDARAAEEAFQQASTLASGDSYVEAFLRAEQLEQLAPTDPRLPDLMNRVSVRRPITTDPAGAAVFYKAFDDTSNGWRSVGQTPLKDVRLPAGAIRLRIEKPAYETREFIAVTAGIPNRPFVLEPTGFIPAGMVRVPKSDLTLTLYGYDYTRPLPAAEYLIDRFEVTNEQFKAFVDAGGYTRREFWKEPFVANGKTLSWEEAVAQFRDKTGRPRVRQSGKSGRFPAGGEKYPVSGVSWYEAAAYAEFSGKQLPTIYHWLRTASVGLASFILR